MSMLRTYYVECRAERTDGMQAVWTESIVTDTAAAALLMVEHYRTTSPVPLSFSSRVVHDEDYTPGRPPAGQYVELYKFDESMAGGRGMVPLGRRPSGHPETWDAGRYIVRLPVERKIPR